jgi:hypothetical protein
MDIYLTADAVRGLEAARLLAPAGKARGFLLGHRRGARFIIESTLASPSGRWPSLRTLLDLDAEVGGKIVGFFLLGSSGASRKELLRPIGVGKVLIELRGRTDRRPVFGGRLIDYEDRFMFRPIPVRAETPALRGKDARPLSTISGNLSACISSAWPAKPSAPVWSTAARPCRRRRIRF